MGLIKEKMLLLKSIYVLVQRHVIGPRTAIVFCFVADVNLDPLDDINTLTRRTIDRKRG